MDQNEYSTYESVDELASSLPHGNERIQLREKAINIADLSGNERQQFEARKELINDLCDDGGFTEKYFTVFPWLLNYAQKSGTDDDRLTVLWYYKWVIMDMPEFPSVTKAQIERALEDLRKRYVDYGSNEKVYHQYAYDIYASLGDYEKSKYHHARWKKFRNRDYLDDCEACIINRHVSFHARVGTVADALKVAQPILKGKLMCTHVPKATYVNLLLPVTRDKQVELAATFAEKIYKAIIGSKFGGDSYNSHVLLAYYSSTGDFAKAVKLFERFFQMDVEHKNLYRRFYFFTGALCIFTKYNKDTIKLKLPPKAAIYNASSVYDVKALRDWFDAETERLAGLFDKRNGNRLFSEYKKWLVEL